MAFVAFCVILSLASCALARAMANHITKHFDRPDEKGNPWKQ